MNIIDIYGPSPKSGEIGVEIEMEGQNLATRVNGWIVTEDGSLRGESKEYVLQSPKTRGKVVDCLMELATALKHSVLAPSDRCGVHIHINCQKLSVQQVINFAILYLIVEDILVRWCGDDREGNLFCLRAKDAEYLVSSLAQCRVDGNLNQMQTDIVRYASMNMSSLAKYGSLEFRAMRTPTDFSLIALWIEMLCAVKDKSMQFDDPQVFVEALSQQGADQFLTSIFGDNAKHLFCKGMTPMLYDGVRRVQPIVYAEVVAKQKNEYLKLKPKAKVVLDAEQFIQTAWPPVQEQPPRRAAPEPARRVMDVTVREYADAVRRGENLREVEVNIIPSTPERP